MEQPNGKMHRARYGDRGGTELLCPLPAHQYVYQPGSSLNPEVFWSFHRGSIT